MENLSNKNQYKEVEIAQEMRGGKIVMKKKFTSTRLPGYYFDSMEIALEQEALAETEALPFDYHY
jgi:hypothetical protein